MKLSLADCHALLRERLQSLDYINAERTTEFWEQMVELTTEGLQRAREEDLRAKKGVSKAEK